MLRDETLVHVENWAHADLLLHNLQPGADGLQQFLRAAIGANLCVGGLYVEHGWQVALREAGIAQEGCGLLAWRRLQREEVVAAHVDASPPCLHAVGNIVGVANGGALGSLHEAEAHGIVHDTADALFAQRA